MHEHTGSISRRVPDNPEAWLSTQRWSERAKDSRRDRLVRSDRRIGFCHGPSDTLPWLLVIFSKEARVLWPSWRRRTSSEVRTRSFFRDGRNASMLAGAS